MSARHPKKPVGSEFEVKPSQQELPGAPDPYGRSLASNAPDPFTQFDAKLPGAPTWGAQVGYGPQLPAPVDPNVNSYAPVLPSAPDPFAGYNAQLPGAPEMSVQPYEAAHPEAPDFDLHGFQPQEPEHYETVDGFSAHSPHWM